MSCAGAWHSAAALAFPLWGRWGSACRLAVSFHLSAPLAPTLPRGATHHRLHLSRNHLPLTPHHDRKSIELAMLRPANCFWTPVLILIGLLFHVRARLHALGAFIWQAWQRLRGQAGGFELAAARAQPPKW